MSSVATSPIINNPHNSSDPVRKAWYSVGKFGIVFVAGALAVFIMQYLSRGNPVHLSPDMFISLVFTLALGAASLILALLAINYGRVSEKVITERADKSIEIQMNLFQKSLDLQTQLFDKTMSTLEAIGRSTGITEQRLGDILALYQNPAFLKQVAGKAVQDATAELSKTGKEGVPEPQSQEELAERLTRNIVRELSTKLEGLERAVQNTAVSRPLFSSASPSDSPTAQASQPADDGARKEVKLRILRRLTIIRSALERIPEVTFLTKDKNLGMWDFLVKYKGKTVALDVRGGPIDEYSDNFDASVKLMLSYQVDALIFLFSGKVAAGVLNEFQRRGELFAGKIKVLFYEDENEIQNLILGALESVAAGLPSPT